MITDYLRANLHVVVCEESDCNKPVMLKPKAVVKSLGQMTILNTDDSDTLTAEDPHHKRYVFRRFEVVTTGLSDPCEPSISPVRDGKAREAITDRGAGNGAGSHPTPCLRSRR